DLLPRIDNSIEEDEPKRGLQLATAGRRRGRLTPLWIGIGILSAGLFLTVGVIAVVLIVSRHPRAGGTQEDDAARVVTGYKDAAGAYDERRGESQGDETFRNSRVTAEGTIDRIYSVYVIRNPDVGSERIKVTDFGEQIPDARAVVKGYTIVLADVTGCGTSDEVSGDFAVAQEATVAVMKKGDRVRVAGRLHSGMTHFN